MPKVTKNRRRAVLAGYAVLNHAKADPQFAAILRGILDASISEKRDRELLGLWVAELAKPLLSRDAQLAALAEHGAGSLLGQ